MNDPTFPFPNVGVFVEGSPTGPRLLARWRPLLDAYADLELDTDREAYLSHFVFGPEMSAHYTANGRSVAGFAGPTWARWLVFDIDRTDPAEALADARKLAAFLTGRYLMLDGCLPVYFSGSKGFHILLELVHEPPPAVGFHHVCRTLAESLAATAGVKIDAAVYDANRILRLPNSRHPKTGLFKRRIDADALFRLDTAAVRELARNPAGDGIPSAGDRFPEIADDWESAEAETRRKAEARAVARQGAAADAHAPRYFTDFLRFETEEGDRHQTLFRCAAWMAEQGSPPALVHAVLTEPGRDVGLAPADVARQITCGIAHARRQGEGGPPV